MKRWGESQKQRKTRLRRDMSGYLYYWVAAGNRPRRTPKPRAVARALRRHPPTICRVCERDLVWYVDTGSYDTEDRVGRPIAFCLHIPANGKRPTPYWGDRGGVSR